MTKRSIYHFDPSKYTTEIKGIFDAILSLEKIKDKKVEKILRRFPKDGKEIFSKHQLEAGLKYLHAEDLVDLTEKELEYLQNALKMKPTRTISGVTTVTVLTKPFMCPGKCIFCPNDVRMPKSYIASEPGAQRALANRFSPYLQTWNRLKALENIGHPTEKIELLVLGGTWSSYPTKYKIWFISECFRAMNDFGKGEKHTEHEHDYIKEYLKTDFNDELREKLGEMDYNDLIKTEEFKDHFESYICSEDRALNPKEAWENLERLHEENATAKTKCVGLVLETRPDSITKREALRLRKLGATKIQLGIQTLDDEISTLNKRGEGRKETSRAFQLLRAAGFKIHAHMMPNLYGATPAKDIESYKNLFGWVEYKPDEVKIYPTSTIKYTELHDKYESGEYKPYSTEQLIDLIAEMMEMTPEYCRLTRIIRDIPSQEIEAGNKTTNLREYVEWRLKEQGRANPNIRNREVKDQKINFDDLQLDIIEFETDRTKELFLQYITKEREIAGFLRLSLPVFEGAVTEPRLHDHDPKNPITSELDGCAMIREVHVYGPSLEIGKNPLINHIDSGDDAALPTEEGTEAQHIGLGSRLIDKAKEISKESGYDKLAVISAIGTREYYKKRGFDLKEYYQITNL